MLCGKIQRRRRQDDGVEDDQLLPALAAKGEWDKAHPPNLFYAALNSSKSRGDVAPAAAKTLGFHHSQFSPWMFIGMATQRPLYLALSASRG
jgi:hypothetical protein